MLVDCPLAYCLPASNVQKVEPLSGGSCGEEAGYFNHCNRDSRFAAVLTAHAQTTDQAPNTMAARVLACASCHGAEGEGTSDAYFPRLAGKPAGYLYNQLIAFREGRRRYPPMNFLLEFLPDAYLQKMAEYFAALRPPFPAPRYRSQ